MAKKSTGLIIGAALLLLIGGVFWQQTRTAPAPKSTPASPAAPDLRENLLIRGLSDDQKMLQLTGLPVTDDDIQQISARIFKEVTTVLLRDTKITDKGLASLKGRQIELLDLTNTAVTGAGLAQLKGLPIKRLLLGQTKIGDNDLKSLEGLPIEWIFLNDTLITDNGLAFLKTLPIRAINLSGTKITDVGLIQLKPLNLARLDLENTAISDLGMNYVTQFSDLAIITIGGTKVTEEGKKALLSKRPSVKIIEHEIERGSASPAASK